MGSVPAISPVIQDRRRGSTGEEAEEASNAPDCPERSCEAFNLRCDLVKMSAQWRQEGGCAAPNGEVWEVYGFSWASSAWVATLQSVRVRKGLFVKPVRPFERGIAKLGCPDWLGEAGSVAGFKY